MAREYVLRMIPSDLCNVFVRAAHGIDSRLYTIKKPSISEPAPAEAQPTAQTARIASMSKSIKKEEAARK